MVFRVLCLSLAALALQCAAGRELSPDELAKIDFRLQPQVLGTGNADAGCGTATNADGTRSFRVIIRGKPDDLRGAGIPLISSLGDVCTALLTADQLREAARLPSVRALDCGSSNVLQTPPPANR